MVQPSLDTYLRTIRRSELIDPDQLSELMAEVEHENGKTDTETLSQHLLSSGQLTRWQNDKILQGRTKGFFLGKYKLLDHLGTGGMSSVYLAEHTLMHRRAAVKVLPIARVDDDSSHFERFHREAQAIASLNHPNIVQAYNADNEGKIHYMVMEFVEGKDLQRIVQTEGPLSFERAADYIRQSADGLEHAHSRSMIHRDIKPANLLVDTSGVVKVLDMGLARLVGREDRSITVEHNEVVLGTTDYLAPEQALDSHSVDLRADIYALGCTFYFLLVGHAPFPKGTLAERLLMHQNEEPPSILIERPDTPADLIAIIQRMMAKRRENRYQSCQEISDVLTTWLLSHGHEVRDLIKKRVLGRNNPHASPVPQAQPVPVASNGQVQAVPAAQAVPMALPISQPAAGPVPEALAQVIPESEASATFTDSGTEVAAVEEPSDQGFSIVTDDGYSGNWSSGGGGGYSSGAYSSYSYRRSNGVSPWVWIFGGMTVLAFLVGGFWLIKHADAFHAPQGPGEKPPVELEPPNKQPIELIPPGGKQNEKELPPLDFSAPPPPENPPAKK